MRILLAGESWTTHTIHIKGFDSFTTSAYDEGAGWFLRAMAAAGHQVDFIRNHEAPVRFPTTAAELAAYDVVVLSDIGSNTLLLHPATFTRSEATPNRAVAIRDYVLAGGGLLMVGGYMSFSGINGAAKYQDTEIQEVLPVQCLPGDDRIERPEGIVPEVVDAGHPVLAGVPAPWPAFLGYNRTRLREGAQLIATIGPDPFIAAGTYGKGRSMAFTSDFAPHWGPPGFLNWEGYGRFFANAVAWLAGKA